MPSLPYPRLDDLPADAAAALEAFPVPLNIVHLTAHASSLLAPLLSLCTAVMTTLQLKPRHREMLILLVAHHVECTYEWDQHLPQAKDAGLTDHDLQTITDPTTTHPDPVVHTLLSSARTYLSGRPLAEAAIRALRRHFSNREIVEALYVLGYVRMFTDVINTLKPDPDPAGETIATGFKHIQNLRTPMKAADL